MLVSKILQNISNNVTTSSKEPFMQLMNNYVEEASPRLNKFFAKLCVRTPAPSSQYVLSHLLAHPPHTHTLSLCMTDRAGSVQGLSAT